MVTWLKLNDEQRKAVIDEAEQLSGINAKAIEKDWWVTLSLKALFEMPQAEYLVFKGGTSLSKCWNLIERFSEDIDIALSPEAFKMKYEGNPGSGYLSRLKKKGCEYTSTILKKALEEQLMIMDIPAETVIVEAAELQEAMPDTDPQTLFVKYISLYDKNPYLDDQVKIEVSVRSLKEPHSPMPVQSMLHQINPKPVYAETPFPVMAMQPQKTFLEKLFLLHEEFKKPDSGRKIRTDRMSRHLYDIEKIMDTEFGKLALNNQEFYDNVITHRRGYSRYNWLDYESLRKPNLTFLPPLNDINEAYQKDYAAMKENMFYGEALEYENLITRIRALNEFINKNAEK